MLVDEILYCLFGLENHTFLCHCAQNYMFLTGSHKVGLMGLVLVPSSTLKTEMEIRNQSTKGQKGKGPK